MSNLTGWELTQAYAINNSGQITGTGLFQGVEHTFRLSSRTLVEGVALAAPEPGAFTMMLAGSVLLLCGSIRKCKP